MDLGHAPLLPPPAHSPRLLLVVKSLLKPMLLQIFKHSFGTSPFSLKIGVSKTPKHSLKSSKMASSLLLIHFLRLLLLCQSVHSVVLHPHLRALNAAAISSEQLQQRPHHRHLHHRHIKTATATAAAEEEEEQTNNISRGRWYGEEAKQMLRQLDELRLHKAIQQQQKAVKLPKLSLFDKFMSLFTEKPDDEGSKHDCFFSAFNCPVNPARNIPGVRRVRITAEERNKLLANRRAHSRRARHRL